MICKVFDLVGIGYCIVGDFILFEIVFIDVKLCIYCDVFVGDVEVGKVWNDILCVYGIFKFSGKIYLFLVLMDVDMEMIFYVIFEVVKVVV